MQKRRRSRDGSTAATCFANLIRSLRVLAVQEGRNLYEVMEEALEEYLERRKGHASCIPL